MSAPTALGDDTVTSARPVRLRVADLRKRYVLHHLGRTTQVLDGVSLTVDDGVHLAIAGSSGAGKSTLLKCLYRSCIASSGSILLRVGDGTVRELTTCTDREIAELRGREVGYVSQFLRADPRRGTLDVVRRHALLRGLDAGAADAASRDALGGLGIPTSLWDVEPALLSGGERQRINLACSTVVPPRLLLLDEPVSALDPANERTVLAAIRRLVADGIAIVSVFHDHDVIRALADDVLVLDGGRAVAHGPPGDVLGRALAGAAREPEPAS